ncbi:hypothetical protein [Nibricoccus aquaticus]|uniref:hypothetical protein n=1 Tax=Nibricoccus aquaticus TaxID=2576891 RepID=UPI0010FD8E17|nr:hypothetical protein [Nibricoccus aquaticus]
MAEYPDFSEFSYGYALVDNLARSGSCGGLAGAPRFISLLEEGSAGGGFDVALNFVAWPFFLQFKIPQIMRRRSGGPKGMPPGFNTPYFRMHLRTERVNSSGMTQHEQLMDLERENPLSVFYVTPRFHTTEELDQYYLTQRVHDESEWFALSGFDPSAPLTREPHRIAYENAPTISVLQSTPLPFQQRLRFKEVAVRIREMLTGLAPTEPARWLNELESSIATVTSGEARDEGMNTRAKFYPKRENSPRGFLREGEKNEFHSRLQRIARTVRTRIDAELILAMPAIPPSSTR